MATVEHERAESTDRLEALWRLPAAAEAQAHRPDPPRWAAELARALLRLWLGFLGVLVLVAAAGPEPQGPAPLIAEIALPLWGALALAGFGLLARNRLVPSFACAALAGGVGIAAGIACRTAEHHLGSLWLVETGGFAVLTALALAGAVRAAARP